MIPIIGAEYPKKVIPLIKNARRNIDIVVYDWRWYENKPAHPTQQLNIAFVNAAKRGVQVRAVVNSHENVALLNSVGIKARQISERRTMHTKLLLIDDKILVIGSHNFTRNAFAHNIETSVSLEIPHGENRFSQFFDNLYNI